MLFPALFAPFYGQDIQLRVLHFLNQKPSDIPFIRMGQISLYARKCNVPGVVFAHIYGKNVGYTNETNDSDTNTLSDKKHKTHYWMYTVFDDKSWNECQQKGIMVLGMDDIGDYSQFASKEALRQELIDVYDSSTSRKNQALMAWNFANTVSVNDVIFAKRSNTLVGKGIVTGNYVFDDLRQEYKNVRAVKWLQVGEWEHPGTGSWSGTSCSIPCMVTCIKSDSTYNRQSDTNDCYNCYCFLFVFHIPFSSYLSFSFFNLSII